MDATRTLAAFLAELRYEQLPGHGDERCQASTRRAAIIFPFRRGNGRSPGVPPVLRGLT